MTLSRKVLLIVGLIVVASCAVSLWMQRAFIMPSFLELERDTASMNAERALQAIEREVEQLGPSAADWAYWTDTYRFALGTNPDYLEENFDNGATLSGMKLNYLGIYDNAGLALWKLGWELDASEPRMLGALTDDDLPPDHPLLVHPSARSEVSGLLDTPGGTLLVVSRPILTNTREGPPAGSVVMGRLLDEAFVERLSEQTRLPLTLSPVVSPGAERESLGGAGIRDGATLLTERPDEWRTDTVLRDLYGEPILTLSTGTARDISARGRAAVRLSLLSLAVTGLVTMLMLMLSLRFILLRPLDLLTAHATRIGAGGEATERRLDTERSDEIGTLARTFDDMIDRLGAAQRELVTRSWRSGVAETASGVLHNIGNAITPLNVRLSNLRRDLAAAPVADLERALAELSDLATPAGRAADLRAFAGLATRETIDTVRRCTDDAARAADRIVDVQQILGDQQRHVHSARVLEPVDMASLVERAAAALGPDMRAALRIEIAPSVADAGEVHGTRAALLQVVTNLLVNAAESVIATGSRVGALHVSATVEEHGNRRCAHLCFVDGGGGIRPEHLERIFQRGYTTKGREGSGLGLHWSANTVQDLGGSLRIENAASGQGCRVRLILPLDESVEQRRTGTEG